MNTTLWHSGVEPDVYINRDRIHFKTTPGYVYKIHREPIPFRTISEHGIYLTQANNIGGYVFSKIYNLNAVQRNLHGRPLKGDFFNLFIYGLLVGDYFQLHAIPSKGTIPYNSYVNSRHDIYSQAIVDVPEQHYSCAFSIARIVLQNANSKMSFTGPEIVDLRGYPFNKLSIGTGEQTVEEKAVIQPVKYRRLLRWDKEC